MLPPIRVAVVGGGCGAMTTAFELSRPELNGRFQVTVYQHGWRLGGKGASGRGANGRIEEHGLHIWLGHYENAFRMMRQCYAELECAGLGNRYGNWRNAFIPEPDIGLFAVTEAGGRQDWRGSFPIRPGLPGDEIGPGDAPSLLNYLRGALDMLQTLLLDVEVVRSPTSSPAAPHPDRLVAAITGILARGIFAGAVVLAEGLALLSAALGSIPHGFHSLVLRLAVALAAGLRQWMEDHILAHDDQRHIWEVVDVMVAGIVGILRADLLDDPRGLDALDDYDIAEWLIANGASERSATSPYVRGLYDLGFAHEAGDPNRPRFSAGLGIRGAIRMFFGYRGALFWRMRAGMGDVVFAPLYDVLQHRGVRFNFFHRLTNVGIPAGAQLGPGERTHVTSLEFDVQAEAIGGNYAPLIEVAGRPCWPSHPLLEQLDSAVSLAGIDFESHWERSRVRTLSLEVGHDFDFVVLGTSIGAIPHVAPEILARDQRWRSMVTEVRTVATQAFQIWLDEDLDALGWTGPPYITTAFTKPFETWCDMAHVIPEEAWPSRPATVIYLCSVLEDPADPPADDDAAYPSRRTADVRGAAEAFLATTARALWPEAYTDTGFRWKLLVAPGNPATGVARFATQYWRANVNPTDRYVLSLPGSLKFRISPLDMTYDNMTIAGDWTECGLNSGCTEAAVMSGRLAAHALAGVPALEDIIGFDHP